MAVPPSFSGLTIVGLLLSQLGLAGFAGWFLSRLGGRVATVTKSGPPAPDPIKLGPYLPGPIGPLPAPPTRPEQQKEGTSAAKSQKPGPCTARPLVSLFLWWLAFFCGSLAGICIAVVQFVRAGFGLRCVLGFLCGYSLFEDDGRDHRKKKAEVQLGSMRTTSTGDGPVPVGGLRRLRGTLA